MEAIRAAPPASRAAALLLGWVLQVGRRWAVALAMPIVVAGAVLRFDGLSHRGFLYWDEGKFALEGIRLLSLFQAGPGAHPANLAGKAIGTAKPTHALLIALSYALLGVHDYAPLVLDAVASLAQVIVLFLLARRLFDTRVALVAAALLAVSGYDLIYARSALSESDANLCLTAAVLLWWSRRARTAPRGFGAFGVALLLGVAFTINYRMLVYIAVIAGLDLVLIWREAGWREATRSAALWAVGLVTAPLVWQVVDSIAAARELVLFRSEITYRPTTYLHEVLYQLHGGKQAATNFRPLSYLQWFVARQGWPLLFLLIAGLGLAAWRRSLALGVPALLVVIPFAVYSFAPYIVPRNLAAAIPFACLLSGAALVAIVDALRAAPRTAILALFTGGLLLSAGVRNWALTGVRSGFAQAASYVDAHRAGGAVAVNEVMRFYLRDPGRGCDAPRLPKDAQALAVLRSSGNEYAVIDAYTRPAAWYLARHARVVATFEVTGTSPFGESLIASENGAPPGAPTGQRVTVYSLAGFKRRTPGRIQPIPCTLDQLS